MRSAKRKRMGDLLVESGMITDDQLQHAIKKQKVTGQKVGEVIVEEGWVTEEGIMEMLEIQLGIPHVDLGMIDIDYKAATLINESLAKRYQLIPIKQLNK